MDHLSKAFGFKYDVAIADIDEKAIRHVQPERLVLDLAYAKAEAIIKKLAHGQSASGHNCYLVTCDQVVVHEGNILEKPSTIEEAKSWIQAYAKSPASTVGSVLCTNLATHKQYHKIERCYIHIHALPDEVIEQLIQEGDIMRCAGGLMVEHPLVVPYIKAIEGTQDQVMGLGQTTVMELLMEAAANGLQ